MNDKGWNIILWIERIAYVINASIFAIVVALAIFLVLSGKL